MSRVGRSLPIGPATTPHASSGWSRRAWATIASTIALSMVSTGASLPRQAARTDMAVLTRPPAGGATPWFGTAGGAGRARLSVIHRDHRVEQGLLQIAEVRVHRQLEDARRRRVVEHGVVQLVGDVGVAGDLQTGAHGEAGVVDGPQPGLGLLVVEAHLAGAVLGQLREDRPGLVDLARLEVALGVEPELRRVVGQVRVDVGEE